jgi:hypothetical protein
MPSSAAGRPRVVKIVVFASHKVSRQPHNNFLVSLRRLCRVPGGFPANARLYAPGRRRKAEIPPDVEIVTGHTFAPPGSRRRPVRDKLFAARPARVHRFDATSLAGGETPMASRTAPPPPRLLQDSSKGIIVIPAIAFSGWRGRSGRDRRKGRQNPMQKRSVPRRKP